MQIKCRLFYPISHFFFYPPCNLAAFFFVAIYTNKTASNKFLLIFFFLLIPPPYPDNYLMGNATYVPNLDHTTRRLFFCAAFFPFPTIYSLLLLLMEIYDR